MARSQKKRKKEERGNMWKFMWLIPRVLNAGPPAYHDVKCTSTHLFNQRFFFFINNIMWFVVRKIEDFFFFWLFKVRWFVGVSAHFIYIYMIFICDKIYIYDFHIYVCGKRKLESYVWIASFSCQQHPYSLKEWAKMSLLRWFLYNLWGMKL